MADFSLGGAAGAGFRLIARKPLAVLVWGLLVWALMLPILGLFASALSALTTATQHMAEYPGALNAATEATNTVAGIGGKPVEPYDAAAPPELALAFMRLFAVYPLIIIGGLVLSGVLMAAVCRAVLEPDDSSFAYLRFGMREVWMVLVNFVMRLILAFASLPLIFIMAIVAGVSAAMMHAAQGAPATLPLVLVPVWLVVVFLVIAMQIWLGMRLIMGLPMSYDDNQFRLFESWAFTRGHGWKLVGLLLLLIVVGIVMEVAVFAVCSGVFASFAGPMATTAEQWREVFRHPPANWSSSLLAVGGGLSLVIALFVAFAHAIFMAPWVEAYRQLRDSGATHTPQYTPSLGEARPIA